MPVAGLNDVGNAPDCVARATTADGGTVKSTASEQSAPKIRERSYRQDTDLPLH